MNKDRDTFTRSFLINWFLTILVCLVLWITVDRYFSLSFLLGSMTSMMMMSNLLKSNNRLLQEGTQNVERRYFRGYVFRYFFYAFILVASALIENFNVVGTAFGLLSFRVSLYISLFLENRGVKK